MPKKYCKKECPICGKVTTNLKFCSAQCHKISIRKNILQEWLNGNYIINQRPPVIVREYIKEKQSNCCAICSLDKWLGKDIPLVLDHINGHSEDNSPENLRLVCGNCDMQLPTYKAKNIGNGRAYRRERYKQGKSY